jgi:hypothetical protein
MKLSDLPIIKVARVITPDEATAMVGDTVPVIDANINQAGIYVDAETDEPFLAYFPMEDEVALLRRSVLSVKYGANITRSASRITNLSRTFGMSPRAAMRGRDACKPTTLAREQPEEHGVLIAFATKFANMFKEFAPHLFEADVETMAGSGITDEWRMTDDALWTSGVINKSSQLPYHRDAFNFQTWSAMPVIRKNMNGGYLNFPEYNATIACRDGWVLFFPGYKFVHGVTPMEARAEGAYRYSVVYYALRGMKDCFTFAVETARGKTIRTEREDHMKQVLTGEAETKIKPKKAKP